MTGFAKFEWIYAVLVEILLPWVFDAFRVMEKIPVVNVCDVFCAVLYVPSPKLQFQLVGVFVEVSVNWTMSGAVPYVGVAVKFATGANDPDAADTFTHVT
jgi:hypothetical protein